MTSPTWIRPWYWRIPYQLVQLLIHWYIPHRISSWALRAERWIIDHYGPFGAEGPCRGYWVVVNDQNGRRLERSPDVPRNYAIEPEEE